MAPLTASLGGLGTVGNALLFIALGIAFGYILESSGFARSTKLAGQFYFTDSTVLQVMFGSIVVTAILLAWSGALGLLNFDRIFVNPTFFTTGILGGLIMGVGFTIGGYCPGTSLVSMSTLKKDGILFVLGASIGIFFFGESVSSFQRFFDFSGSFGRYTLPELFGWDAGVVVFLITLLAMFMIWGSEKLRVMLHGENEDDRNDKLQKRQRIAGVVLVAVALPLLFVHQPSLEKKWGFMSDMQQKLKNRDFYVHPAEVQKVMHDDTLSLAFYDLSDDSDWNHFHLLDAQRLKPEDVKASLSKIKNLPEGTITILMSRGEKRATEAFKLLAAGGVLNLYILEGGTANWQKFYGKPHSEHGHEAVAQHAEHAEGHEALASTEMALGDRMPGAEMDHHHHHKGEKEIEYTSKIKIQKKVKLSGGCG